MSETILVLGGTRSGKSRLAARLAAEREPVTYVATATVDPADQEWQARVRRHQDERPADWATVELPRDLADGLPALVARGGAVIVDCLTLWISNLMLGLGGGSAWDDAAVLAEVERAAEAARGSARVVWVANEVGWGGVSANALARRFADLQGLANQRLAAACDAV